MTQNSHNDDSICSEVHAGLVHVSCTELTQCERLVVQLCSLEATVSCDCPFSPTQETANSKEQ